MSANLLNDENQVVNGEDQTIVNTYKAKRLNCKKLSKTYIPSLGECLGTNKTLAVTDFSPTDLYLHGKKPQWNFTKSGSSTTNIHNNGDFLAYSLTSTQQLNLRGKTIEIEFDSMPVIGGTVLEIGNDFRVTRGNTSHPWKCIT